MTFLLWLLLAQAAASPPDAAQHLEKALRARQTGDVDRAIREFEIVSKLNPASPEVYLNLGVLYLQKRDSGRAVQALNKAIELKPDLPGADGLLGTALLSRGYAADAMPHLEKAGLHDLLGVALLELGKPADAIPHLESAAQSRQGDPDILYYLALAHSRLAQLLTEQITTADPQSPRAHQLLAEAYAAAGKRKEAFREYASALALRPDLPGVHLALGELDMTAADYEQARREFQAEVDLSPGNAQAQYRLGCALVETGKFDAAVKALERADTLSPGMPETLLQLARALTGVGDLKGAETRLRRLLEVESNSFLAESAHFQLAGILRRTGRAAEADREMALFRQMRDARTRPAER